MAILNDLIASLVERNEIQLGGGLTIGLDNGAVKIKGEINSQIRDHQKNKTLITFVVPIEARVALNEIVIPIPTPRPNK